MNIDKIVKEINKTAKNLDKVYTPKISKFGMIKGQKGVGFHHLTGSNKKFHHKKWLQRQQDIDQNKDNLDIEMNKLSDNIKQNPYFMNDYLSKKGHISKRDALINKYKYQIKIGNNKPITKVYQADTPSEVIKELNHPAYYDKYHNVIEHPKDRQWFKNDESFDFYKGDISKGATPIRNFAHHVQKLAHHPTQEMKKIYYDYKHDINPESHLNQSKQKESIHQMLKSINNQQKYLNKEKHIFSHLQQKVLGTSSLHPKKDIRHQVHHNRNLIKKEQIKSRNHGLSR